VTEDDATGHKPANAQTKQPLTLGLSSETREENAKKHERNPTKQQRTGGLYRRESRGGIGAVEQRKGDELASFNVETFPP